MRRSVSQGLLLSLVLVWGATGCNCGEPPVESELAVAFDTPKDGRRLTLSDDADPATDGFQYEVVAVASDTSGRAVTLASAKLEVRTPSEQTWTAGPQAVIEGGTVRFPGTVLQPNTNLLQVTVEEAGSHRTATQRITVTVSTDPPSVDLTQPTEGQVLREGGDADPDTAGYQVRFSVRSEGLAGKSGRIYCEQVYGVPSTPFTVNGSGLTQVSVTLSEPSCEAQHAECYAVVDNNGTELKSSTRSLVLDTVAPRVEVVNPVAAVTSTTFQVDATVACAEPGSLATLSRPGVADLTTSVGLGGVSFPAVTLPGDRDEVFTLRVVDAGGNATAKQVPVTVAGTSPSLNLIVASPVTSDADPALEGVQVPVRVQVDTLPTGTEVRLFTSVSGRFERPQRAVTEVVNSVRVAQFTANLAEGANTVQACVRNAAGLERCMAQSVTVSTGQAPCRILSPDNGALLRAAPAQVRVESGAGPVTVKAVGTSFTATGSASFGPVQLPLPLTADGEYRIVATCPNGATSQLLSLGVDSTPPALSFNVHGLPEGQFTLGSELNDTALRPGLQVALDVSTEPRASVVAQGCGMKAGAAGEADGNGALLLRGVSVPSSGACELQVIATDLAGNTTTKTQTLTREASSGGLRFLSPENSRYLAAADGTSRAAGGLLVEVRLAVPANSTGTLRLLSGTTELASVPVTAADTEKAFPGIALEEGVNLLKAQLLSNNVITGHATALVTVDTQPGTITLDIPTVAPAPVYLAAADVSPAQARVQAPLKYTASVRPAGSIVDICTDVSPRPGAAPCRDGSGWFLLASNVPSFVPDFTYPDGRYALKAVLDKGAISSSQAVTLTVDSTEPVVRAAELVEDINGDRKLNGLELPSGSPQLRVAIEGAEDGRPVDVRSASNRTTLYGQGTVMGGVATVKLSSLPATASAEYSVVIVVSDQAGNPNRTTNPGAFYPLNTAAFFAFRVDRAAPSVVVSSPTQSALGLASDASPAAGFQVIASVNTDADVGTGGVHMELSPSGGTVELTPSGLVATHEFTLPSTGKVTYTLTITATDSSGNVSAPVVRTFTVDLEPPSLSLVTPAANTAYTTTELPVRVDVGSDDVSTVRILVQQGTDPSTQEIIGDLPVVSGVAQGTLNFPVGTWTVIAQAADPAGNAASTSVANVDISQAGCNITITRPSTAVAALLAGDDADPATPGLQYRLRGNTLDCRGRTVTLFRGATSEATATADATTGDFFFDVTFADGEHSVMKVQVTSAASLTSEDSVDITVDLTPPVITAVSPSATTLFFVASTNAFLFPTPAPDRVVDQVAGGDANATFSLTVTQGTGSRVQAFYENAPVSAEFTLTTDPETVNVPITLPHDTTGTLEFRVQDAGGNVARHSVSATVDVVPPAAPTVTRTLVAGQERAAKVAVAWTASGDDGLSGTPAGYDLRWTNNAQLANGISDEATFYSSKVMQATGNLLPATTTSYELTLPPLSRYSIQVRPRDEVGNYPPFQVEPQLDNFWQQLTLTNPATGNNYGLFITSRGDLNADGRDDLVVSASSGVPGTAYVYYGSSDPVASPPIRQDLTLPETGSQAFGSEFDVGDVGNATADAVQDLLVSARGYQTNSGRAFLYFGRRNGTVDTAAPLEFRNVPNVSGAFLGLVVKMIGDITGDGLQELMITSHAESPPKIYMFYGRSVDAWRALGTSCNTTAACLVPTSAADKVFTAPAGTPFFGRNRGYARLGDITGDGVPDFTIPVSHETVNNVYVFSGASVRSMAGTTVPLSSALQVLHQDPNGTANGTGGFGTEAWGGVNFAGGAGLDLVVSMSTQSKIFVYRDGGATGFPSPPLEIRGGARLGTSLALGDLNGDGKPDIATGVNLVNAGTAHVFYNRGVPGAEFDTQQENGFFQSKLESTSTLGISLTTLDFNGDGKLDLAVSDSQSSPARVVIYY